MRPIGAECSLALEIDGMSIALPFSEETLRMQPVVEEREPLLGMAASGYETVIRRETTGCVVTRVGRTSLPALLHACLGTAEEAVHVPETRGTFSTDFRLAEKFDGFPSFSLVADRGVEKLCYQVLSARGFELRGVLDEPLYLRLDVSGREASTSFEAMPELTEEEYFYFETGSVVVDGVSMPDVYEFALSVDTDLQWYAGGRARNGRKAVTFTLHAPLDDSVASLPERTSHTVDLGFRLVNTFPEPNHAPGFSVRCEDMVLRKEQKEPDSPDELCSPYTFVGRGGVTAKVVREEIMP